MVPSTTYFPRSWSLRADWYDNFSTQFTLIAVSLGFTAGEAGDIDKEAQQIAFMVEASLQAEAYLSSVRSYRDVLCEADDGSPTPAFPPNPTLTPPFAIDAGMFERLDNLVKRIKLAPGYTEATGELLGIEGSSPAPIAPGDVEPDIDLSAALHNYLFSIVVSNRHDADSWQVFIKPANITEWQMFGVFTGKSADITYTPGGEVPGPVQLEVYIQLRRNNANYGQPSPTKYVTVNP